MCLAWHQLTVLSPLVTKRNFETPLLSRLWGLLSPFFHLRTENLMHRSNRKIWNLVKRNLFYKLTPTYLNATSSSLSFFSIEDSKVPKLILKLTSVSQIYLIWFKKFLKFNIPNFIAACRTSSPLSITRSCVTLEFWSHFKNLMKFHKNSLP